MALFTPFRLVLLVINRPFNVPKNPLLPNGWPQPPLHCGYPQKERTVSGSFRHQSTFSYFGMRWRP